MVAPLSGVRVIEVANYVAAPSTGALLADLGADVIKVEPPGGEVMRGATAGTVVDGRELPDYLFTLENRGKRSVTVDLNNAAGLEMLDALLARADVLLTNLILPRLEKYGLAPAEVLQRHPRIVHVSVTGYGLRGPDAARLGFDFAAFWTRAGIMGVVGHPGQPPVISRVAQGDHTTGINALAATLAALRLRDQTGQGQAVEVSLQMTGAYTIATDLSRTLLEPVHPPRSDRENPSNPLFNTYETADGRWMMLVHMTPDPYWPKLCRALGEPEWAEDPRFTTMSGRRKHGKELYGEIQARFLREPLAHWAQVLDECGLIWAPMVQLPEVVADPQLEAMGSFVEVPGAGFRTMGVPFRVEGAEIGPRAPMPTPGQHNAEVFSELGIAESQSADWAARGAFG
jgi:crotonobetainyl-CoA:carnitine CoA-transferase CaiB-like acyl-CoA transferase